MGDTTVLSATLPHILNTAAASVEPKDNSWKRRVCLYARALPAVIALIVCVIGVIFSLICNSHLYIAFLVGTACSIYGVWLSLDYSNQKAMADCIDWLEKLLNDLFGANTFYQEMNKKLEIKIKELAGKILALKTSIAQLGREKDDFHTENETLKITRKELDDQIEGLQEEISALKGVRDEISKKAAETSTTLTHINLACTKVQNALTADHKKFDESAALLTHGFEVVQTNTKEFGEKSQEIADQMKKQADDLLPLLRDVLEGMSKWKEDFCKSLTGENALKLEMNNKLSDQIGKLQNQIGKAEGQQIILEENVKELKSMKDELMKTSKDMRTTSDEFKGHLKVLAAFVLAMVGGTVANQKVEEEVIKAAHYFQNNYPVQNEIAVH